MVNVSALINIDGELNEREKEIRRLRRALQKYGRHTSACQEEPIKNCICGLAKSLKVRQ